VTEVAAGPDLEARRARRSCFAAFGIQGFGFASLITRLPTIKDRFELSDYQVLAVLGTVAVLSGLGSVLAGYAAARWGSGVVLRLALAGASVCIALIGVPHSLVGLLLTTCSYGLCVGAIDATMNMQGVGIQDRYGRSIMVGFHGMWSLGAVVGGVFATITLEVDWPLLPTLLVVSGVGLLLNGLLCRDLLVHDPIDGTAAAGGGVLPGTLWWPVLLLAIPTFVMWFLDSATSAWGGIYLTDGLSASESAAALAFTGYQAVLLLTRLVGDAVVRRLGAVVTARASGVVAFVAVALVAAAPSVPIAIAGFALLGAGLAMIPPLSMVAAGHLDPEGGGRALALVNVSNYLGYLVAALTLAVVAEQVGHRAMFVLPLLLTPVLVVMAPRFGGAGGRGGEGSSRDAAEQSLP
jgi:MFS family permease